ncbi:hypothetical protein SAMD00019534_121230, partial [Acytostelium subglobosum LB1]|uniref:hypothetical protein n=1 Tax=Acytostelium subglobosum LB1 TaxID=1410327 RepID=UPI000644F9E1
MESLPLVVLHNIVSNLVDNIDRVVFSLVSKRLFQCRDKYLHFNTVSLVTHTNYGWPTSTSTSTSTSDDKSTSSTFLNSYQSIIINNAKCKPHHIYIYSSKEVQYNNKGDFDQVYHIHDGMNRDAMRQQLLDTTNVIESITFKDKMEQPFTNEFWTWIQDILLEMMKMDHSTVISKSVELYIVTHNNEGPQQSLNRLPMNIELELFNLRWTGDRLHLPITLTSLRVACKGFNKPLDFMLPDSLKSLDLEYALHWNQPIASGGLPSRLEVLKLSTRFNWPIVAGALPPTLLHLEFGDLFDQPDLSHLPQSLLTLNMGCDFNRPLHRDSMPGALTTLCLSHEFNHPLSHLPSSLTDLTIGDMMGRHFVQEIDHPDLRSLYIALPNPIFSTNITFCDLTDLRFFHVQSSVMARITSTSFPRLDVLTISGFSDEQNNKKKTDTSVTLDTLPLTITTFDLGPNLTIKSFPKGIKMLRLQCTYNIKFKLTPGLIPSSVTSLNLYNYSIPLGPGDIPDSVTELELASHELKIQALPPSLKTLRLVHCTTLYGRIRGIVTILREMPTLDMIHITSSRPTGVFKLIRLSNNIFLKLRHDLIGCGYVDINMFDNKE